MIKVGNLHFQLADDWEAVYLDGKLLVEGHSVGGRQLAEALGYKTETSEVSEEWLEERGWSFPGNLEVDKQD